MCAGFPKRVFFSPNLGYLFTSDSLNRQVDHRIYRSIWVATLVEEFVLNVPIGPHYTLTLTSHSLTTHCWYIESKENDVLENMFLETKRLSLIEQNCILYWLYNDRLNWPHLNLMVLPIGLAPKMHSIDISSPGLHLSECTKQYQKRLTVKACPAILHGLESGTSTFITKCHHHHQKDSQL